MFNKQKGFTLIELLVVIAIIGLLAGIVLVSLGGARDQARDARITSAMSGMRTQAEIYNSASSTYVAFDCVTPDDASGLPGISALCDDISTQNGGTLPTFFATTNSYCATVVMNDGFYCVDNTFVSEKGATAFDNCGAATAASSTCSP